MANYFAGLALLFTGMLWSVPASAQAVPPTCPSGLATADLIDHDFSVSFCELCEIGTVRIEIENPFRNSDDADFSDIVVTENLLASGLTYVPNSTQFSGSGVTAPPVVEPVVSGPDGSIVTWTLSNTFVLPTRANGAGGNATGLAIEFNVRRASIDEEGTLRTDGWVVIGDTERGLVLRSPEGRYFGFTVDDEGRLVSPGRFLGWVEP
jgi:hypothetical protein